MNNNVLIFEGYDGSGKSTLIGKVLEGLDKKQVRVVGRKNEESLKSLSLLIEQEPQPFSYGTEVLLRIALEMERLKLVFSSSRDYDFVIMDRGLLSLRAWIDYYNLDQGPYDGLLKGIETSLEGATMFLCDCDFEECWRRISEKVNKSRKELLGRAVNEQWYEKYSATCEAFSNRRYKVTRVDTSGRVERSMEAIWANMPNWME